MTTLSLNINIWAICFKVQVQFKQSFFKSSGLTNANIDNMCVGVLSWLIIL